MKVVDFEAGGRKADRNWETRDGEAQGDSLYVWKK
jgi:hypothetical protein